MTPEKRIAKLFGLNDKTWMKHSNQWSVWTRFTVLPLIALAFWSRVWIGDWYLLAGLVAIAWTFVNPHLFPKPKSTKSWASRSVHGERVWLNRDEIPVPAHHKKILSILNGISGIGFFLSIWAVVVLNFWALVVGILFTYLGKTWYLDRMVWILQDMEHVEEYKKWIY